MNLRNAITRTITYTEVTVSQGGESYTYTVNGSTTPRKEMSKVLKKLEGEEIPVITTHIVTEKRALSLEDFIQYSTIINDEEN